MMKESKGYARLSNADRSEQSGGCNLVREVQYFVKDFVPGKTIRGGWRENRGWGKVQWGFLGVILCLHGQWFRGKIFGRSILDGVQGSRCLNIYEQGITASIYVPV